MGDYSGTVMSQAEIAALKETLCAQQKLLQKLYNELDAEREASATAASEALSVILRLQGEKAAVKMEAEQYKRLAEEKMCHAEESFAIIEDIIYQKEMEVAALDYQVQAYRYKLLSMGCIDPGGGEIKYPENLLQRNESLAAGDSSIGHFARRNSAPLMAKYKKGLPDRESSMSPEMDLVSKTTDEQTYRDISDRAEDLDRRTDSSTMGLNSFWEQIKKLDVKVKEIAGANYQSSRNEGQSSSPMSSRPSAGNLRYLMGSPSLQPSVENSSELNKAAIVNEIDQAKNNGGVDYPCPPNVLDVFEVPQAEESCKSYESVSKDKKKTASDGSKSPESENLVHPEAVKLYAKDEPDWVKKLLQSAYRDKNLCKPSNVAAIDSAVFQPSTSGSESQPNLVRGNANSEIVELERPVESVNREEELNLLKEIKEQLNVIHDEITGLKVKKLPSRDEPSCCPLPEAMLHFWL